MSYFTTRDLAAVITCAALWGVLNMLISPIFWQVTHMPFLCDLLAFTSLILVIWWTRKFGAVSLTGLIVSVLTLVLRPTAFHMLGFIVGSFLFDILTRAVGYKKPFESALFGSVTLILFSTLCAGVAGTVIGSFFMGLKMLPAIVAFSGLHAVGGLIGGVLGVVLVRALMVRKASLLVSNA